ncbi:MAG: PilZ domain-containing protein [Deltaproteobacteria bacterium]|nr:PilZ domain-containing protein [Deltaproteobacteria bacterium]
MSQDKRRGTRHLVCVLAHLEKEASAKKRSALINDVSAVGAHLLTREKLAVGDKVQLQLHLADSKVIDAAAKVVRINERPVEQASLWTMNVGVEFERPIPELADAAVKEAK